MVNLGVKLHSETRAAFIRHGGKGAVGAVGDGMEARRQLLDAVPMRHPDRLLAQRQERVVAVRANHRRAVFAV